MAKLILLCLIAVTIANGQSITHSELVLNKVEGKPYSFYPVFTSKLTPRAAECINRALQMWDFGKTQTAANPGALAYEDEDYEQWSYKVDYVNSRLIHVMTSNWIPPGGMHTPDRTIQQDYFFDAQSGDRIYAQDFFRSGAMAIIKPELIRRFEQTIRAAHSEMTKRGPTGVIDDEEVLPNLDGTITYASEQLNNYRPENISFDAKNKSFGFRSQWLGGNYHYHREVLTWPEVFIDYDNLPRSAEVFSDVWLYYSMQTDVLPATHTVNHVWSGLIGGKIPVTIMIWVTDADPSQILGLEVYDKYGTAISLNGNISEGKMRLNELDDKNVIVGYFEFRSDGGRLTGTWHKGDESKTMEFTAVIAGGRR